MHSEHATGSAGPGHNDAPVVMDPDATVEYLREMLARCLDPQAWEEGEFPADYAVNSLEVLTTLVGLDRWLSEGGRLPVVWSHVATPRPYHPSCRTGLSPARLPMPPATQEGASS